MTDLIKAADDARRILKGFKAFAEVADALDAAGQIEQRTAEAQRVLADLQPKIEAAKAAIADAGEQASNTLAVASQQASSAVARAEVKASEILGAAQTKADSLTAAADRLVAQRQAEATSAAAARDSALVQRNALTKEIDELEAKLAKTRGQIAKLLG